MHDRERNPLHSIGVSVDGDGRVTATRWNGAAFAAGVVIGTGITVIDAGPCSAEIMPSAITRGKSNRNYRGGPRWPWLERVGDEPTGLDRLLAPSRTGGTAAATVAP